eukprot:Pgem_evm1s11321
MQNLRKGVEKNGITNEGWEATFNEYPFNGRSVRALSMKWRKMQNKPYQNSIDHAHIGKNKWTDEEVENLCKGVKKYGDTAKGVFGVILDEFKFNDRSERSLQAKWFTLLKNNPQLGKQFGHAGKPGTHALQLGELVHSDNDRKTFRETRSAGERKTSADSKFSDDPRMSSDPTEQIVINSRKRTR